MLHFCLICADVLDLTVVGLVVGNAINVAAGAGLTAVIGWKAYKYFTSK